MDTATRVINWRFYYVKRAKLICSLISLAKKLLEKNYSMVICVDSSIHESTHNMLWDMNLPHGTNQLPNELHSYNPIWLTSSIYENPIHAQYLLTEGLWSNSFSNIAFFHEDQHLLEDLYMKNGGFFFYEKEDGRWIKRNS